MLLQKNWTWVLIGDSLTAAGRADSGDPTPWRAQEGWGHGYVNLTGAHIEAICPELNIRLINRGVAGNTIRDLKARWEPDVLALQPDCLSVCIGVNDVWRQCDTPLQTERQVLPEEFEAIYRQLLAATRPQIKCLILIKPFVFDNNRQDRMRRLIDEYGEMVEKLAKEFDAQLADPQPAIDCYLQHRHSSCIAWDRVHPNTAGYLLIARELMKTIGLEMG
jgi:lysophospholipase L1-like esterase